VLGADTVSDTGTKAALWYTLTVAPGATAEVRLRLAPEAGDLDAGFTATLDEREAEADSLYAGMLGHLDDEAAMVVRQALAGMMWTKQWFHYDVEQWLEGDPAGSPPPEARDRGRNHEWRHLNTADVLTVSAQEYRGYCDVGPRLPVRRHRPPRSGARRSSSCWCAGGTCTPAASCPPTSEPSAT
jgi:hypothetical protein